MSLGILLLAWVAVGVVAALVAHVFVVRAGLGLTLVATVGAALAGGLVARYAIGFGTVWSSVAAGAAALGALWARTVGFVGRQADNRSYRAAAQPAEEAQTLAEHPRVREARHNVLAVYPDARVATRVATDLEQETGLPSSSISLQTRPPTNARPAADAPPDDEVAPLAESQPWERDARAFGGVFVRVVPAILLAGLAGAVLGFVVGALLYGPTARNTWILVAVLAGVAHVVGFVGAGVSGAFREARRDAGVIVGAHSDDPALVRRAEDVLRRHRPLRVEHYRARR